MKKIVYALLAFFLSAAFGQPVEQFDSVDLPVLRALFVDPIPGATGNDRLINGIINQKAVRDRLDKLVAGDKDLQAFAARGEEFLKTYIGFLREDMGDTEVNLAMFPEGTILQLLRVTDHTKKQERHETERKEQEARSLALQDTGTRFGLGQTVSASDIERFRYTLSNGETIYQFYRRQFMRYLITPVERPRPDNDAVRQFKRKMIQRLEELKSANFEGFIHRIQKDTSFRAEFLGAMGKLRPVKSEDIVSIAVDLLPPSEMLQTEHLQEVHVKRGLWKRWVDFLGKRWHKKDLTTARTVYFPQWINANTKPRIIRVQLEERGGSAREFFITESDLSDWINTLKPVGWFGGKDENLVLRRYLLESASRNAVYTDLIAFLEETEDKSLEEFRLRIQDRFNKTGSDYVNRDKTLTERLRAWAPLVKNPSKMVSVVWAGFGVHPEHWNIRETAADYMFPSSPEFQIPDRKEMDKVHRKAADQNRKAENRRLKFRYQNNASRVRYGAMRRMSQALMAGAIAGTLWTGYQWINNQDFSPVEIAIEIGTGTMNGAKAVGDTLHNVGVAVKDAFNEMMKHLPDLPDLPDLPERDSKDTGTSNNSGGGSQSSSGGSDQKKKPWFNVEITKKPSVSMSDFDSPQNFSIDEGQDGGGRRRGGRSGGSEREQGAFGFDLPFKVTGNTNNVLYYLVARRIPESLLPRVYDNIREQNFPREMLNNQDPESEPEQYTERLMIRGSAAKSDFSVITNLVHYHKRGRIALAVPDNSKLVGLQVRNKKGQILVEGRDYRVYRLKTNHLLWIELATDVGGVGYQADYEITARDPVVDPELVNLKPQVAARVNEKILEVKMNDLYQGLRSMRATRNGIPVEEVEMAFANKSTYTYSSKMWQVRGPADNPFTTYTKFLNEKGQLHWQCTGSNATFVTYMNTYYQYARQPQFKADNLTAWAVTEDAPVVTLDGGHYRSVVQNMNANGQYRVLDATPGGSPTGPRAGKPRIEKKDEYKLNDQSQPAEEAPPSPAMPKKKDEQKIGPAVLPERPRIPEPKPVPQEDEPPPPPPKVESTPEDRDAAQELLLRKVLELRALRKRVVGSMSAMATDDRSMDRIVGNKEVPGHGVIAFARRLDDYATGQYREDDGLANMKSAEMRWPQPSYLESSYFNGARKEVERLKAAGVAPADMISGWSTDLAKTFNSSSKYVEKLVEGPDGTDLEFTLDATYQSLIKRILKLLQETRWGVLHGKYREQALSCDQALSSGGARK